MCKKVCPSICNKVKLEILPRNCEDPLKGVTRGFLCFGIRFAGKEF